MIQYILFYSFGLFALLHAFVSIYVMILLKDQGKDVRFFDVDYTNYRSLKRLSEEDERYKGLYRLLLISTFVPIAIFVSFFIYSILTF